MLNIFRKINPKCIRFHYLVRTVWIRHLSSKINYWITLLNYKKFKDQRTVLNSTCIVPPAPNSNIWQFILSIAFLWDQRAYFYLTAFFLSLSSILVCSHGHLENKNQPALSSAESLPQAEDKASSPASCFGKEWWSGMWGLLWVLGFPVTGKSLKMLTCETYGSKEPLQTLLSLNKVQKSFRRADHVYKKQGIRQVGRKPLRAQSDWAEHQFLPHPRSEME